MLYYLSDITGFFYAFTAVGWISVFALCCDRSHLERKIQELSKRNRELESKRDGNND